MVLKLPTHQYLKEWLIHQYGNPVKIPRSDIFRAMIIGLLQKRYYEPASQIAYLDSIDILITESQFEKHGFSITQEHIEAINKFIEKSFKQEFYNTITHIHATGKPVDDSIRIAIGIYGITEFQWSFNAIRIYFYSRQKKYFQFLTLKTASNVQRSFAGY